MTARASDPDLTNFDIFVLALSVLSIVNMVLAIAPFSAAVHNVVLIVDGVLCLIFLADFFLRLTRAPQKRTYLIDERGWLDLLGSLPFPGLRLARLFRMARVSSILRRYGPRRIWEMIAVDRAGSALLGTLFLTIIVLEFGSLFVLAAEARADNANILTASDALWWSYVTVTTVGYGDRFPVTTSGRLVGVAMLTIGVGLFGVLTGFLANAFLAPKRSEPDQRQQPSDDLRQEIAELKSLVHELSERGLASEVQEQER
jgi:voltage-gated potassium channel Kch